MTCRIFRIFVLGAETDGHDMPDHSAATGFSTVDMLSKIEDMQEATVKAECLEMQSHP